MQYKNSIMYEFEIKMLKTVKILCVRMFAYNIHNNFEINVVDIIYYFCGGFILNKCTLTHGFTDYTPINAVYKYFNY